MNASSHIEDPLILESIVVSSDGDGNVNVAPMGPIVDRELKQFHLRPFASSTTYRNLRATSACVIHVCDDVSLFARAAIGRLDPLPPMQAIGDRWWRLSHAARWFAVEISHWIDDAPQRPTAVCRVCHTGGGQQMFGFNRAKHAVLEAAILATRIDLLPAQEIADQMKRLRIPLEKTGGRQEREAFELLDHYVAQNTQRID